VKILDVRRYVLLPLAIFTFGLLSITSPSAQENLVLTVVPFKTQADQAYAYLGESFSETLSTKLVGLRGIKLYERSQFSQIADELKLEASQREFFDQDTVSRIGKIVSIDYMLMGSATLAGPNLSCSVRLVNVNSGKAVLAREFRGTYPKDLFNLQDEAALAIANTLTLKLSDLELRKLTKRPTQDLDAFGLYNSCLLSKDDKQRIALLEKAVARDPGFIQAWNLLADLYETVGRTDVARGAYERILEADPEDYRATYNLALLDLDQEAPDKAIPLLSHCLELKGDDPDVLYHLGLAHEFGTSGRRFDAGSDIQAARSFYEQAQTVNPKHREALYALGVVCANLSQTAADPKDQVALITESRESLKSYLDIYPDSPNKEEVQANIDLLVTAEKQLKEYLRSQ
jgi:tetratricopeptide (TPR) repeat protein